jgi:hypothetical protein
VPATYRIDRSLRIVLTTLAGVLTDQELIDHQGLRGGLETGRPHQGETNRRPSGYAKSGNRKR